MKRRARADPKIPVLSLDLATGTELRSARRFTELRAKMSGPNPRFYWTAETTPRGVYYAIVGTGGQGEECWVEYQLFSSHACELYLVDRQVISAGDWITKDCLIEDQLHLHGARQAEACMAYDLTVTGLAVCPELVTVAEGPFISRLIISAAAPSVIRLAAGSRCEAVQSFRQRVLLALTGGDRPGQAGRGQP